MPRFRMESRFSLEFRNRRIELGVAVGGALAARPRSSRGRQRATSDLETELAQYTTPAELLDLHSMIRQYDDEDTEEVRAILAEQAVGRSRAMAARWPLERE